MKQEQDYEPAAQLEIAPGKEITVGQSMLGNPSINIVTDTSISFGGNAVTIHEATDKSIVYDLVLCGKNPSGERKFSRLIMTEEAAERLLTLFRQTGEMRRRAKAQTAPLPEGGEG